MPCIAFPPVLWWVKALSAGAAVQLHTGSPGRTTDYRNRYCIATANGSLLLSVPVRGGRRSRAPLADMPIDYTHSWQRQHWGALFSAYGRAPFYEHYGPELESLIFAGHETLLDFNLAGIEWLRRSMRLEADFSPTDTLGPATEVSHALEVAIPYHQVFEERWGFLPNLSAIDLLMAEGPYALEYMRNLTRQ